MGNTILSELYRLQVFHPSAYGRRPPQLALAGNELLSTIDIDVVGRTRERSVGHHMRGERCNVGRADDAPDGERGAQLTAALIELVAKDRCRQGCVDESGGDQIDSDGREFERQVGYESGHRDRDRRRDREVETGTATAGAAHEQQRPPGRTLPAALRATSSVSMRCSSRAWRVCA